jgi:hypothetical protein
MIDRAMPSTDGGLVKVSFPLDPQEWEGIEAENMWAQPVENGKYRIQNIPFYAYGVSAEDIVNTTLIQGVLTFASVARRGGHSTYRILLSDGIYLQEGTVMNLWGQMQALGCTYEGANSKWLAVDVPPSAEIYKVYSLLEQGEEAGVWSFDEGHCGHPVLGRN